MSNPRTYKGPVTGHVYDLSHGEKIDPVAERLGGSEYKSSPIPKINGENKYRRIFIQLRTPYETLTCRPIEDASDFANRVSIIENWFNSIVRGGNYVLTFEALQITDEQADELCEESV